MRFELRDKKLKVSWNLPRWVARQIAQSASKSQKHPAWWWTAHNLQTLAERVEDDAEFQHLAQALELAAKLPRL